MRWSDKSTFKIISRMTKRFVNKLESKNQTLLSFFLSFFFYRLVRQMQQDTLYNQTTRTREEKKKEKGKKPRLSESSIRARARKYFNRPLPTISLFLLLLLLFPPSSPSPVNAARVQKHGHVCRAGETEPEFTHRRILSKMRSRSIKSREIPRPCHKGIASIRSIPYDVSPAAGVLRIVRPSLARLCSAFRLFGEES